jgi:hypothetical protein
MNNSLIVSHALDKAHYDLDDAMHHLGATWVADDHDAIGRLTNAGEALMRAIASVTLAVERLAALPVCEGHSCSCESCA